MLELLFRGFFEWIYGLILECWEYFSSVLFDLMSLDFAYLETYMPIITTIRQIMLGVGWALLLGNLVFQATRSMVAGIGFEADDPKLLFTRTFVFSFLLVASPQICDICLNMTSVIIDMVQMPDAAAIKLPDEGFFVDLTASWLLVIVFGLIVMFQTCKLFFEMAERYFILAVLTITAPLAFGVGGSRSTSDIFSGWCRMYGSMCLLMVMNVVFVKMLLSILSFRPSGIAVLPWIVMVLTVVKVAKKSDAIITRIGLNPAITGDSLGRSFPGVLTYTVARTMASRVVQTAGKNTAAGKTGAQTQTKSSSKPGSKPASGGRYYGGVNTVNTFADSRRSEQQSGSSPRQAEPRASGAEPTAQPASAATDRSFVMPGTRRPVSHVPGEQKIAPSDTAGKAGHTVSRSSHVQAGAQQHISIPIKNIMNEAYCRSLSQKLRAQFRVQRKAGEFLGAFACYGYLKDPADKHKLIIDEYAAMVVRTIFQLKMEGYSQQAIANYLSSEGVLPPAAYKQQQGLKYQSGFQAVGDNNAWSPVAVRAILENPIYIGTLVQGKRGTPNYKIKQMKLRSKEDWCVVEKNHAPIISEELFTSVQHLLSLDTRTSPSEEVVQPLAGMLYCADCGRAMCRRSVKRGNRTFYYYVCSTHKRSKLCSSHSISQTALEDVVLRAIQKQIEMVVDIDQLIHEIGQKSIQAAKHRQLDMTIEEKEKQITEQKEYRMRLLEAFHDDLISRTEYDMMRQRYTQRIDALQAALASLHERRQALEEGAADSRNWVAEYTKFRKLDKLTREMVAGLIRRITVSEGKQITIQFNYADELASYQQMIAAAAKEVG